MPAMSSDESTPASTPEAIKELLDRKLENKFLVRKEIRRLPELLDPGEALVTACSGTYENHNGLLAVTDRRVLFVEEGMVRKKLEEFHYGRISSAQRSSGMLTATLTIITSGNKSTIKNIVPKVRADEIVTYISGRITGDIARSTASHVVEAEGGAVVDNPVAKIRQLAELRDAGVLSDEEFEAKKAELLKQI